MVVHGDSHAGMWLPALVEVANDNGWTLHPFVKYGCPSAGGPAEHGVVTASECDDWHAWASAETARIHPGVTISNLGANTAQYANGLRAQLPQLKAVSGSRNNS
jgi:hypothetical protein